MSSAPPTVRRVPSRTRLMRWSAGAVAAIFVLLVAADLNGTSLGMYRGGDDPDLLAGAPRPERSDEWAVRTPLSVGGDRVGLPEERQIGLTYTEVPATAHGGPSSGFSMLFKPQDWGYQVLDASHGLAWSWWFSFASAFLAVLWLLSKLGAAPPVAVGLAFMATFSPYTGWWTSPPTPLVLAFACLVGVSLLTALSATSLVRAIVWAGVAAYFVVASVLLIYPPWTISTLLVIAALVAGQVLDQRTGWRRVLVVAASTAVASGAVLIAWAWRYREAIEATASTGYPGQRVSEPGSGDLAALLSAPMNFWAAEGRPRGDASINVVEASSTWIPAGLVLAAVLVVVLRRTPDADGDTSLVRLGWTTSAVAGILSLLLVWALVDVPDVIGSLTLLERVPGTRVPLALGLAVVLLLAIASIRLRQHGANRLTLLVWVGAVVVTVGATWWSRRTSPWFVDASTPLILLGALVLATALTLLVLGRYQTLAAVVVAAYCVASWVVVNPLYRGLGALQTEPIVEWLADARREQPELSVIVFEEDRPGGTQLASLVNATGVTNFTATTFYPDREVMERLGPDQEPLWNNYARYRWVDDPTADPAVFRQLAQDFVLLTIDPCSPATLDLGYDLAVSDHPLDYACLDRIERLPWEGATTDVYVYEVSRGDP